MQDFEPTRINLLSPKNIPILQANKIVPNQDKTKATGQLGDCIAEVTRTSISIPEKATPEGLRTMVALAKQLGMKCVYLEYSSDNNRRILTDACKQYGLEISTVPTGFVDADKKQGEQESVIRPKRT